jgi:hypothetical protein
MARFNRAQYIDEMRNLAERAVTSFQKAHAATEVNTISVWTDGDARRSAVAFDTFANSARFVADLKAFAEAERAKLLAQGNDRLAAHFEPFLKTERNTSPADFQFRTVAVVANASFSRRWTERSGGACWEKLAPALTEVVAFTMPVFRRLQLHPQAELGVNGRRDWYDRSWPL